MASLKNWILAARPKTLTAAVVPIFVSVCFVSYWIKKNNLPLTVEYWIPIIALLCSLMIQIATNFYNDAIDFKNGADNDKRLGPTRASHSGLISPELLMQTGHFCLFLALIMGSLLVVQGGLPILAVGVFSLFFSYAYTGGPYPLAYKGWGDFFVLLFFGWIAVAGMVHLMIGAVPFEAWVLGTQIGCLSTTLIAINNYRDQITDRDVGKMTLAARFGKTFSRVEFLFLILVPYGLSVWLMLSGHSKPGLYSILLAPVGVFLVFKMMTSLPSPELNKLLALAALHHLLFGFMLAVGFLFSM